MGNIIISTTLKSENPVAHRCQHPLPLECFISSAFCKHSLSLLASPARISRQRQTRRPRLLFSFSAKCLHQRQQQQEEEEEAAAAGGGGNSSNSSRRQQQQQQQQGAASKQQASSKQAASKQQASSKQVASKQQASSKQAASKQKAESSNQRLPCWKNNEI